MTYTYDGLGRIKSQKDARNQTVTYTYDSYGRVQSGPVGGTPLVSNTYGTDSSYKGLLLSATVGTTCQAFYTYDGYGRITAKRCVLPTEGNRTFSYTYGADGLLTTKTYPDGTTAAFQYDAYGNHVSTTIGSTVVWQLSSATGSTTQYQLANAFQMEETCNAFGMPTAKTLRRNGTPLHGMTFSYNAATGNLTQRTGMLPATETFAYDALERLTQAGSLAMTYSPDGNIMSKTDMGQYYYEGVRPHAVTGIDNSRFLVSDVLQTVTYNQCGKATRIQGSDGYDMSINYGPEGERWQGDFSRGTQGYTMLYLDDYEEKVTAEGTRSVCYLDGGVMAIRDENGILSLYVPFTDHLGSVTRIYDSSASDVFSASYDAWGSQTVCRNDIGFHRGYTGHEMLPDFGLINMNGRLYDTQIGRFLSTDNYVQEPYDSQNFNRYSYCLNNPLKYTDPSGEIFGIDDALAVILVGAVIGGTTNLAIKAMNGQINGWGDGLAAFGIGAVAGGVGAITGGAAFTLLGGAAGGAGGFIAGAVGCAVGTATSMPVQSLGNHIYFGDPMITGRDYFYSIAFSAAIGGAFNGALAIKNGRSFWSGRPNMHINLTPLNPVPISKTINVDNTIDVSRNTQLNVSETVTYDVTTNSFWNNSIVEISEEKQIYNIRPSINGYDLSKSSIDNLYHRFPTYFDKQIINEGQLYGIYGNSSMYYSSGHINGTLGIYTIGINNETGIIYHRCFYSMDKFLRDFKFPR